MPDEQERFEAVNNPPPNPRGGLARWTHDSAKRVVGWKVDSPESVQENVGITVERCFLGASRSACSIWSITGLNGSGLERRGAYGSRGCGHAELSAF
ncbi:DUF6192 family protein [Streptomyces sp. NPDC005485]|uniref:DUF6192 family protein n=1 Tax=Streptomyces sp. NPDC005485 TaxID=3155591 RepID=UPI00339F02CB